ncbi:4'-phosphopantetheinyl transferase family protein [Congregibacter litoralis]|uniref:Enterobactin synthase component D n=1 Tax=Congregibacter litoralis KT71 TaxID=314285 RepID=A4A3H7_9GAMM|nr:4'-phosphopantetheinyl transferase superfamily protein [Congregibacter litoralis]EAQ99250.1 Phosphopantetheinyl transferase component of siderophore synthetase [Congregibacter litoralis KT71]
MLADQLPSDVVLVIATVPMESRRLSDIEETSIAAAGDKRQREFRSGRNAAKTALRQLGLKGDIILPPDSEGRRPSWPPGYVGSITHTRGFCAAAVAMASDYTAIGIDAEPRTPLKKGVVNRICTARELHWIAQQGEDPLRVDLGKVMFCIKESIYKVFNPLHDAFLGFQEADVQLNLDAGRFSADVHQRKEGIRCQYRGRFGFDDDYVYASTVFENAGN